MDVRIKGDKQMTTLKDLVDNQKYTGESDLELIKQWFISNEKELEGIEILSDLASAKANKLEDDFEYARAWIPAVPRIYEANNGKIEREVAHNLDRIVEYHILGMPLHERMIEWAKETIPNMKTPTIIFRPAIEWLKSEYGIEFKDKTI